MAGFQALLANADKAAQHAFDFPALLAKSEIRVGVQPADIMGNPQLGLQFSQGAACDAQKIQSILITAAVIALGDIRRNRERSSAHLIT